MRAHVIENGKIVNTIEVERLDALTGVHLIDAAIGGAIGDGYDEATGEIVPAPSVPFPPEEIQQEVTMRQARLALLAQGVLGQVDAAIESLPSPARETARIEWDYSSVVSRNSPLVVLMGGALGLDEEALDQLFITAATL